MKGIVGRSVWLKWKFESKGLMSVCECGHWPARWQPSISSWAWLNAALSLPPSLLCPQTRSVHSLWAWKVDSSRHQMSAFPLLSVSDFD